MLAHRTSDVMRRMIGAALLCGAVIQPLRGQLGPSDPAGTGGGGGMQASDTVLFLWNPLTGCSPITDAAEGRFVVVGRIPLPGTCTEEEGRELLERGRWPEAPRWTVVSVTSGRDSLELASFTTPGDSMRIAVKDILWLVKDRSGSALFWSDLKDVLVQLFGVLGAIAIIAFPIALIDQGTPVEEDLKYLGSGVVFLGVAALSTLLPDDDPWRSQYALVTDP